MMTQAEINEYWRTPGPKRDRRRYAYHSIEEARQILAQIPEPQSERQTA